MAEVDALVSRKARLGFSGSGVGKSVLLSTVARNVSADISIIGLVGERSRDEPSAGAIQRSTLSGRSREPCRVRPTPDTFRPSIEPARSWLRIRIWKNWSASARIAPSSADVDEAIAPHKPLEAFLSKLKEESTTMAERTSGWSAFCEAKKHKTNVIGAQSTGTVQNMGTRLRR